MSSPIKISIKTEAIPLVIIAISIAASFYFYSKFPDTVATHWNYKGEPDDYSSKALGAFLMPAVAIVMYFMFLIIPYIDPKKNRYEQFSKVYHIFKSIIIGFLLIIYFASSLYNLGYDVSISTIVPAGVGLLFLVMGNYMSKIKPNWFMGIRTPWTLSSDIVWNKTHRLGGKLFMLLGIALLLIPFIPRLATHILISGVAIVVLVPIFYSLYLYKKISKNNT